MVTTVASVRVPPLSVAVTVTVSADSWSSSRVSGSTLSVIPVGASSSSVIVVETEDVPRLGAGPPPPDGLEMVTVNVSSDSSVVSSVVWTVKVCGPAAVGLKVSVPDAES